MLAAERKSLLTSMRICRFCLTDQEPLVNILDCENALNDNSIPFPQQILMCVSIKVSAIDGKPQVICKTCRVQISRAYKFKSHCRKSDNAFQQFFSTGNLLKPTETISDILKLEPRKPVTNYEQRKSLPVTLANGLPNNKYILSNTDDGLILLMVDSNRVKRKLNQVDTVPANQPTTPPKPEHVLTNLDGTEPKLSGCQEGKYAERETPPIKRAKLKSTNEHTDSKNWPVESNTSITIQEDLKMAPPKLNSNYKDGETSPIIGSNLISKDDEEHVKNSTMEILEHSNLTPKDNLGSLNIDNKILLHAREALPATHTKLIYNNRRVSFYTHDEKFLINHKPIEVPQDMHSIQTLPVEHTKLTSKDGLITLNTDNEQLLITHEPIAGPQAKQARERETLPVEHTQLTSKEGHVTLNVDNDLLRIKHEPISCLQEDIARETQTSEHTKLASENGRATPNIYDEILPLEDKSIDDGSQVDKKQYIMQEDIIEISDDEEHDSEEHLSRDNKELKGINPCAKCDCAFPQRQFLDIPPKNHHQRERNTCSTKCKKSSKSDRSPRYESTHSCEKSYKCTPRFACEHFSRHDNHSVKQTKYSSSTCNHSFSKKDELNRHQQAHKNKTSSCDKNFACKQRNVGQHYNDKLHKCDYCNVIFDTPTKLGRHITSHAGVGPHPCKFCADTFLLNHHLTLHKHRHHSNRKYN